MLYCANYFSYKRRKTREVKAGVIGIGGSNPIRIQSMTTTNTMDTGATAAQALRLINAGCEIVRITAPSMEAARNLGNIKKMLLSQGVGVPLVADVHFLPAAALEAAEHVEKVRINPGNYADSKLFKVKEYTDNEYEKELERIEEKFTPLVLKLQKLGRSLRIGVNHGSLSDRILNRYGDSPEGMVESALEFVRICEKNSFYDLVLSMKSSNTKVVIAAYRLLAARMGKLGMEYPFHLGVTEAGDGEDGRIKSAIGIGSLLEDGLGDTIRVSLTEEPEREIPVCSQISVPYNNLSEGNIIVRDQANYADDPFHYSRRKSSVLRIGPFTIGGENPMRVTSDMSGAKNDLTRHLREMLAGSKDAPPEMIEWTIRSEEDLKTLDDCRKSLFRDGRPCVAFWGRFENSLELLDRGLHMVDMATFMYKSGDAPETRKEKFVKFLKSAKEKGIPVVLESGVCNDPAKQAKTGEITPAHNMLAGIEWAEKEGLDRLILSFRLPDRHALLHNVRYVVSRLRAQEKYYPIHLRVMSVENSAFDDCRIDSSIALGALVCDGIGDFLQVRSGAGAKIDLELMYNILQAAGARITKTEYISCPSCGRTLFDLQSATERIRSKTRHLKGVRIAIMGCIVNGPGEMADADFGYVGGAPGKINLYVGKECVEKGIPAETADEKLIELIKSRGKWREP